VLCGRKKEYKYQAIRVGSICEAYNHATLIFDRGGPGEGVNEMLQEEQIKRHFSMQGIVFNNLLKSDLVNSVCLAQENGDYIFIDPKHGAVYSEFINQMEGFERKRSASGLVYTYSAPSGFHDDAVTSVLLRETMGGWDSGLKKSGSNSGPKQSIISRL